MIKSKTQPSTLALPHNDRVVLLEAPKSTGHKCWAIKGALGNWVIRSMDGINSLSDESQYYTEILEDMQNIYKACLLERITSMIDEISKEYI